MASMQKSHEEQAKSAAQKAADKLEASRQDRSRGEAPAMSKAGEMKDAAVDRARGAMDDAADKARDVRDAAADMTTDNDKAGNAESEEEDVMMRVKAADQMTGQAFNDVGPMGEEGTGFPRRRAAADMTTDNDKAGNAESEEEEDVMLRVKAADQMTGQAFNDVGPMGEEGTGFPRRRSSN